LEETPMKLDRRGSEICETTDRRKKSRRTADYEIGLGETPIETAKVTGRAT
jgi:hypothetical protein